MAAIKIGVILSPPYSHDEGPGKELYEDFLQIEINASYPNLITFDVKETDIVNDEIDPPDPLRPNSAQQHLDHFNTMRIDTDLFIGGAWSNQAAKTLKHINNNDVFLLSPSSSDYSLKIPSEPDPIILAAPNDSLIRLYPCTTYLAQILASCVKDYIKYRIFNWSLDQVTIIHGKDPWGIKLAEEMVTQLRNQGYEQNQLEKVPCPLQPNDQFDSVNDNAYVEEVLTHLDANSSFRDYSNTAIILLLPWKQIIKFINTADDHPLSASKKWFAPEPTHGEYEQYCTYAVQNNISTASKIHVFTPIGTHKETPELQELQADPWISSNMLSSDKPELSFGDLCWIDAAWIMAKAISLAQADNPGGITAPDVISKLDEAASQQLYSGPCEFDVNGDRSTRDYDIYAYKKDAAGEIVFEKVGMCVGGQVMWKPYGPFMTAAIYWINRLINFFRNSLQPKPYP